MNKINDCSFHVMQKNEIENWIEIRSPLCRQP